MQPPLPPKRPTGSKRVVSSLNASRSYFFTSKDQLNCSRWCRVCPLVGLPALHSDYERIRNCSSDSLESAACRTSGAKRLADSQRLQKRLPTPLAGLILF